MMPSIPDLIITIAYFSIPVQILIALCKFPRLTRRATKRVVILLVLFAFFIFLCGAGHLLRCIGHADTLLFHIVNVLTAIISLITSIYLMPFVPHLLEWADKLYLEAHASKRIIESMYPATIREQLLKRGGEVLPITTGENLGREKNEKGEKAKRRGSRDFLLERMSRSESMAIRRIHEFIQKRRVSTFDLTPSNPTDSESDIIAENFPDTSIMFADISNFTHWSSNHSPSEVFNLLESLFFAFDQIATEMEGVYKVSTVGDCYIASAGVPYPREDHAVLLVQFAERCRVEANKVIGMLSKKPEMNGVTSLRIRIGVHSGEIYAGVLRGKKPRFDLFGDTINTAQRIESTGLPDRIHLSRDTAEILEKAGKADWLIPRDKSVSAKGKGELKTFWLREMEKGDDLYYNNVPPGLARTNSIELMEMSKGGKHSDMDSMEDIIEAHLCGTSDSEEAVPDVV